MNTLNVGIIGLGFMGGTHISAYLKAAAAGFGCRVAAVCDADPARLKRQVGGGGGGGGAGGNLATGAAAFDPSSVRTFTCIDDILADPGIDLIDVCTPTDTHVDIAVAALNHGKHVLVEKPVALTTEPIRRLKAAAEASGKLCMPAMCMRFWPAWAWLKAAIADGRFGALRALNFQRIGAMPTWSAFFMDPARSGGAGVDLHIHDCDFAHHCVGRPAAVTSAGHVNHLTTIYHYDERPTLHVTAQGGWLTPPTAFRMRYLAEFEHATADFDIGRPQAQQLLLAKDNAAAPVELEDLNGYDGEIRHFVTAIAEGKQNADLHATLDDAIDVAIILETEQYAAECGQRVRITWGVDEPPGH
jgi:predicted dehydrogenase